MQTDDMTKLPFVSVTYFAVCHWTMGKQLNTEIAISLAHAIIVLILR